MTNNQNNNQSRGNSSTSASLDEMVQFSLKNTPQHSIEAIDEYFTSLSSVNQQELDKLKLKLNQSVEYRKKFQKAIVETSLILFLTSAATFNKNLFEDPNEAHNINLTQKIKQFNLASSDDDQHIYNMRVAYITESDGASVLEEVSNLTSSDSNLTSSDSDKPNVDFEEYENIRLSILDYYTSRYPQFKYELKDMN